MTRLEIEGVEKRYGSETWALRGISLALGPGVHGLLGPNGAGKSSLMRILATIAVPTAGRVAWNGTDIVATPDPLRAVLGYLPQDFGVYPNLSSEEFLAYLGAAKGLGGKALRARIDTLLALVNLADVRRQPVGGFSGGMRQRLGIAQALLNDPRLLIVDEPTAGLDPEERVRFRNLLSELGGERIVLLSTHIVSDVEAVASSIALIARGRLLAQGAPETLLAGLVGKVWQVVVPAEAVETLKRRWIVSGVVRRPQGVQLRLVAPERPAADAEPCEPSLEDAYLEAMGRARRDAEPAP